MTPQKKIIVVLGAALFLSLSANLFMGGLMLGRDYHKKPPAARDWHDRDDKDNKADREARREEWKKRDAALREKLPEADRAIVEEHMKTMRETFKTLRDAADAAEDKADAARAADPFDAKAYETALQEQATAKAALVGTLKSARAGLMEKLSPEGRKVMKEMGPRFKGGTRDRDGREGRDGDRNGWRKRGEDGERGGRFFDRRPDGPPPGESRGEDGPPPPPPGDAPPPPEDVPPPPPEDAPAP